LSSTAGELIAARIVQGAGAAIVMPLTLLLISDAVPVQKRGAAIGIWGGVSGLGVAAGPVVGGAIVQGLSWQWIFWLNVPVGVVTALVSSSRLRESRGSRSHLDIGGLALAGTALIALTWAPIEAPEYGWGSPRVIGAVAAGVVLLAAFLIRESRTPHPMVPIAYFRRRGFSTSNAVAFLQFVSVLGSLFMITQLFQIGLGYAPLPAGVRILVWMAMPMLIAPAAGALADRFGNRPFMVAGLLLQSIGLAWLGWIASAGIGYGRLVGPLIIAGVGIALCFPTVTNAVVTSLPVGDSGIAAGVNSSLRELGGVFGIAILAAVFAANGDYSTPENFIHGFRPAMAVAATVPVAGLIAALLSPSRAAAVKEAS
jgi:EmrB/QacA subfamily drug resistance transporter